ncbi:MAG: 3-hydroxyacyl-CoA dehydrogenase [Pseudomonadales bacterium]|nr:3-hydroxyacyl-CoA dehydrogenase [Pseudomonadales bacterium]
MENMMSQLLQTQLIDGTLVLKLALELAPTLAPLVGSQAWSECLEALGAAITGAGSEVTGIVLNGGDALYLRTSGQQQQGYTKSELLSADNLLTAIANSAVPVVASITGAVNDFGWQLALCCDYRVASSASTFDHDLLKHGTTPGFGGSQRLPRLVGMNVATRILTSPSPVSATKALEIGLIDLIDSPSADGAVNISVMASLLSQGRKGIDAQGQLSREADSTILDKLAATLARRRRAQFAPQQLVEALRIASNTELLQGLDAEREIYKQVQSHEQRGALSYLALGEQQADVIPGLAEGVEIPAIRSAAIIGSGTMGGGIAMCFANVGIPVTIIDNSDENLQRGLSVIKRNYEINVKRGSISQSQMDQCWGQVSGSLDYQDISDADIVIEAVFEDMQLKKKIFATLDEVMKPGALLGSNTSGLDIDEIASATKRPGDVIGLHFFSPANVMKLLEVVRGTKVSDQTILRAMSLAKIINKVAVLAGNCPGFIGNRMIRGYMQQGANLVLEGATIEQVDRVMVEFGMPMGPFTMGDLTGLDVGWRARLASGKAAGLTDHLPNKLCEMERFGQKSAAGYYRYEEGSRKPIVDPLVASWVEQISAEQGIERRTFDDQEVLRRCLYPLINEGAKIIEDGIAIRASDIDTVYVNGYGFPAYRGGPMYWANQIGLDKVHQEIENYHQQFGDTWKPAKLLKQLAQTQQSFS